ncbi:MAG: hypothetical protein AB9856_11720 [Cellulosilyticaceae bacterium]
MTPNEFLLTIRQEGIRFYRNYEKIILPCIKFIAFFMLIMFISKSVGTIPVLMSPYTVIALSLLGIVLTDKLAITVLSLLIITHLMKFNISIGCIALGMFIILYICLIRLYPRESLIILVMMIAFKLRLEYAIPIIAALFGSFICIVPMILGVFFWFTGGQLIPIIQGGVENNGKILDIVTTVGTLIYQNVVMDSTMLSIVGIFIIVFTIVYIIRKQSIDYAPYIAICVGGVMSLLGFVMSILFLDIKINVLLMVFMTIISVCIAIIVEYASKVLDYPRAEVVQFEDEDNYYYVKVVPKINIMTSNKRVKKVYSDEDTDYINDNNQKGTV